MNWLRSLGLGFTVGAALASAVACSGTSSLGTADENQEGKDGGGTGGSESSGGSQGTGGANGETGGRTSSGGTTPAAGGATPATGGTPSSTGGRPGSGGSGQSGGTPGAGGKGPDENCADRACAALPPVCPAGEAPGRTEDNCCVRCLPVDGPEDPPCPDGEVLVQGCAECGLAGGCRYSEFRCRPRQDCASGAAPCAQGAYCGGEACVDFGVFGCI